MTKEQFLCILLIYLINKAGGKLKISIFVAKTIISIVISAALSSFIAFSVLNNSSRILSSKMQNSYADLIISKQPSSKNGDFIENTDEVMDYISRIKLDNLQYSSVIKHNAVVKSDKGKTTANIYAIDQESFQKIIPTIVNTKSEEYSLIDTNKYEIILGAQLAKNISVNELDQVIISLSGDRFMHYSDIFTVKFISDIENDSINNSILIPKHYITNILSDNNISSEIYINIGEKKKIEKLKNELLENPFNLDVHTKNDFIHGYDYYFKFLNIIPIIHSLLFFAILLFLYMLNINSRCSTIKILFDNFKSLKFIILIGSGEIIISSAIFVFMMPFLAMAFQALYNYNNIYKGYIAIASIIIIAIVTKLVYILCKIKDK